MEADYFCSFYNENDDYVQDYSSYHKKDVGFEEDCDHEEYLLDDEGVASQPLQSARDRRNAKKKQNRRKKSELYSTILGWIVPQLRLDNRSLLSLEEFANFRSNFLNSLQYYNYMSELAIEEARATIVNGLYANAGVVTARVENMAASDVCKDLVVVTCTITRKELLQPITNGWIFAISIGFNVLEALGTVAQERQGASSNSKLVLWIHSDAEICKQLPKDTLLRCKALGSIISYQRMVKTCEDAPHPPFLPLMLSGKSPIHLNFGDSSDEDANSDDDSDSDDEYIALLKRRRIPNFLQRVQACDSISIPRKAFISRLNSSQIEALKECAERLLPADTTVTSNWNSRCRSQWFCSTGSMKLVQGPPGCGKTFFLATLIGLLHSLEGRMLVCAASNKAVCVLLEEFLRLMNEEHSWCSENSGCNENDDRNTNNTRYSRSFPVECTLIGVEDTLNGASSGCRESVAIDLNLTKGLPNSNRNTSTNNKCFDKFSNIKFCSSSLKAACEVADSLLYPRCAMDSFVGTFSRRFVLILSHLIEYCDAFRAMTSEIREIDGHTADLLRSLHLVDSLIKRLYYSHFCEEINDHMLELFNVMDELIVEVNQLLSTVKVKAADAESSHLNATAVDLLLGDFEEALDATRAKIASYDSGKDRSYSCLAQGILRKSQVIFCTLATAGSHEVKASALGSIDCLLVDEASQALESELLLAFNVVPSNLIMVGDPQQLPATALSAVTVSTGRNRSAMQRLMQDCRYPSSQLLTQYRMHREIVSFPNRQFYECRLATAESVLQRRCLLNAHFNNHFPLWLKQFSFVDTANRGLHSMEAGGNGRSFSNHNEANFIASLCAFLQSSGIALVPHVAIITFYSAQVNLLRNVLQKNQISTKGLRIHTVDSFQGSEADIVLVSFVRCNTRSTVGFVKDYQRLNVALTRAKHLLVCVGCTRTLSRGLEGTNPGDARNSFALQQLISDARLRKRIYDIVDVEKEIRDIERARCNVQL